MSINAIGTNFISLEPCITLSPQTRQALIALGIDPKSVSSEEEAKALIQKILTQKVQLAKPKKTDKNCCAQSEIISKAKTLAQLVGVVITESMSMEKMFEIIEEKIKELEKSPTGKDITAYKNELEALKREYNELKAKENAMYASMNYTADMNRLILGI